MRLALVLICLACPLHAWEARVENGRCLLDHTEANGMTARVSFDPAQGLYAIALTRTEPWGTAPLFSIQFIGPRGGTIFTDRQRLDLEGRRLTVEDTGFGNVLNGLEHNSALRAELGESELELSLEDAAPEVRAFRACTAGQIA